MSLYQTICATAFGLHSHSAAYAALVLEGDYEEAGDQGQFQVSAGDVVLHDRFETHINRFASCRAVVLNLPLFFGTKFQPGLALVSDPDLIARTAETNPSEAAKLLLALVQKQAGNETDWPGELAATLLEDPDTRICEWGEARGLAPWTVSRGFAKVFGLPPEVFRTRVRARHAWTAIRDTSEPFAALAFRLGFADQPHMVRSVKQLTGRNPHTWRNTANGFKTSDAVMP